MSYERTSSRSLVDLAQDGHRAAHRAMRDMADHGGEELTRRVVARTPRRTGFTAASWFTKPVQVGEHRGTLTYESGVASHHYIARFLEHGTHPHIVPGDGKSGPMTFTDPTTGRRTTVRKIEHPGTPGLHLVARAATEVEAEFPALMEPFVAQWAREVERGGR